MTKVATNVVEFRRKLRIIMIGPVPPPVGGTTVSFDALCQFLSPRLRSCIVVDTVRRSHGTGVTAAVTLLKLARAIWNSDVVTAHFSDRAAFTMAPLMWAVCRITKKPFIFRQFGGEFNRTFHSLPRWWRWLVANTIFRSDAVFLQTKAMMCDFAHLSDALHWFPTARRALSPGYRDRFASGEAPALRCLFLGHISRAKGVLAAANAVNAVSEAMLDVYGPLIDLSEEQFVGGRVQYRGVAAPDKVATVMAGYDLLIFPTTHPGEGYSGTLVEAAMVGLPILATRWQSLPEMFAEDEVIFVDPARADDLVVALRKVVSDPRDLTVRSQRLIRRSSDFDADRIFGHFLSVCCDIASRKRA